MNCLVVAFGAQAPQGIDGHHLKLESLVKVLSMPSSVQSGHWPSDDSPYSDFISRALTVIGAHLCA
jgi:hypothetical protein